MKNKTKNTTSKKNRRSMKGKWGKVGAPPKATSYPRGSFTMATLFGRNKNQCELSIRNKVDAMLAAGELVQLKSRRQAHGGVGRPKAVFVLKINLDRTKHEPLDVASATPKIRKPRQARQVTATVAPATPPNETAIPLTPAPVETAPEVVASTEPTNVIPVPVETTPPVEQPVAQAA